MQRDTKRIIWGKFICVLGELDPSMIYWFSKVGRTARTWCRGAARNSTAMTGKKLELEERIVQRYLANVDSMTCCSKSVASKLKAQNEMSGTQLWNCQCAVHVCNLYWVSRVLVSSNLFTAIIGASCQASKRLVILRRLKVPFLNTHPPVHQFKN